MSIESVMPSSHLILGRPLLLLPPICPSIRVFFNGSTLHMRWPKYWIFSLSISPSKEHPGVISFRMDRLDLLAVQGLARVFSNTTVQKHQAEEPEIKLLTSTVSPKKQESSRKTSISALLITPKPLTVWITINSGKFFNRWEYHTI